MVSQLIKVISFFLSTSLFFSAASANNCISIFENSNEVNLKAAQSVSHEVADQVNAELTRQGFSGPQKKGYAILVGAMVGSALLTTYVGSHLGPNLQFLSVFLGQVSTIGVFVLGAPIWEPLSSKFRQIAFGVKKDPNLTAANSNPALELNWYRSQEYYSINAQMSRNLITQFITSVKQNFYEAHRAYNQRDESYAADQIAEAAFRLKTLFRDIQPDDASVSAAVNSAFSNHIQINSPFVQLIWQRLAALDPQFETTESQSYYQTALKKWLKVTDDIFPE